MEDRSASLSRSATLGRARSGSRRSCSWSKTAWATGRSAAIPIPRCRGRKTATREELTIDSLNHCSIEPMNQFLRSGLQFDQPLPDRQDGCLRAIIDLEFVKDIPDMV